MTAAIITAALLVTLAGPIMLGAAGALRDWRHWRLTALSTVLYALAFNFIFFVQELFLVIPKALTPGLSATIYHNNHRWDGDNPIAHLFQGAGALAILIVGVALLAVLLTRPPRSPALRLLVFWLAFHGIYQSAPQAVLGAVFDRNDVGMAFAYLDLSPALKALAAFTGLAVIVGVGHCLTKPLLSLAPRPDDIASAAERSRFAFNVVTLPALFALPILIVSRVPGSLDQVVLVPVAVMIIGCSWLQANAWRVRDAPSEGATTSYRLRTAIGALAGLMLFFHLVLRPGVTF